MNPRRTRLAVAITATIAVAIAGTIAIFDPPPPSIAITYAYTTDAADLLEPLIEEFNDDGVTSDGRRIVVEPAARGGISSGVALERLTVGTLEPDAWTPASSLWSRLLADDKGLGAPIPGRSLLQSPQVVALVDDSYQDLVDFSDGDGDGDGDAPGLHDVLELAGQSSSFRWAHTDPDQSTSGLSAVLAEFHLAANSPRRAVTNEEVGTRDVPGTAVPAVFEYEQSVDHYVDIAGDFTVQWCEEFGSAFADAEFMQETTFLKLTRDDRCRGQFTALYPADARLVADYPFVVMDRRWASWVSVPEQDAVEAFGTWLHDRLDDACRRIRKQGLRRGDCIARDVPGPERRPLETTLPIPSPDVLAKVKAQGTELRRPAKVMLVVDESVDMLGHGRSEAVRQVLKGEAVDGEDALLSCLTDRDSVGLITFGSADGENEVIALGSQDAKARLAKHVPSIDATRGRATLYDAIQRALATAELEDPASINTVIVLAAGSDRGSATSLRTLEDEFHAGAHPAQLVVVPYRQENLAPLKHLTHVSIGRFYDGDVADIAGVREFVCDYL